MDNEDDEDDDGIKNPRPDDYEVPEHSLIASGEDLSPAQNLSEYRESDTIHSLVERGLSLEEVNRLLIPEIELLNEVAERANRRQKKERD